MLSSVHPVQAYRGGKGWYWQSVGVMSCCVVDVVQVKMTVCSGDAMPSGCRPVEAAVDWWLAVVRVVGGEWRRGRPLAELKKQRFLLLPVGRSALLE